MRSKYVDSGVKLGGKTIERATFGVIAIIFILQFNKKL